ncbi:MAG: type II toxin-antitoxin system VapC family toxin [Gammaproteobacteria bacterium]
MKYLLDTCVLLWWLSDSKKILKSTRKILEDKNNTLFVSSVSFWEMAIKKSLGRLGLPINIIEIIKADGFETLPLTPQDCLGVIDLPAIHQDPFDRMLVVQAKLHNLVLITRDEKIKRYPLACLQA